MGRSFWFECSRCGYRAKVSGQPDRGLDYSVQTVVCHDCKQLYDAVTRLRVPQPQKASLGLTPLANGRRLAERVPSRPPSFQMMLAKLPTNGAQRSRWTRFKAECPVSPSHRVEPWNEPDKCPRCGLFMEKNPLPYRLWD